MYATSGGAPAAIQSSLKKENPYYSSEQQEPTNTTSVRPKQGKVPKKIRGYPAKPVHHVKPRAISDGFLHQMFSTQGGPVSYTHLTLPTIYSV